ncbi:hypothetical protein D3C86_1068010 [compost metagenome]
MRTCCNSILTAVIGGVAVFSTCTVVPLRSSSCSRRLSVSSMNSSRSKVSILPLVWASRLRVFWMISLARCPSRIMRSAERRAAAISGGSRSSHRSNVCALTMMAPSGWFSSWESDADMAPTAAAFEAFVSSACASASAFSAISRWVISTMLTTTRLKEAASAGKLIERSTSLSSPMSVRTTTLSSKTRRLSMIACRTSTNLPDEETTDCWRVPRIEES